MLACNGVEVASANTITLTLGEYSSPYHTPGTYADLYTVGTFSFDLSGQRITSATIAGGWGNSVTGTTAPNKLFLDGVQLANTADYNPSPTTTLFTPWSYTFSDFSIFQDGAAVFQTLQTAEYVVRLSETTLTIQTAAVPEPSTCALALLGTGAWVSLRRRR